MTAAEREARILSLAQLVKGISGARIQSLPRSVLLDDIISAGWVGAIQAVDGFDPAREKDLEVYACWKIRSAIADYLRTVDHLTRDHRRAVKRAQSEAVENGRVLPADGMTLSLDYHRDEVREDWGAQIRDPRCAASARALDARITLERIFSRVEMKPRNKKILMLWMAGHRQKAIGRVFGFNESRASQICQRALAQLRSAA